MIFGETTNVLSLIFMLFNSPKEKFNDKYYYYYYFDVYNKKYTNKYGLKTSKREKEIFKIALEDITFLINLDWSNLK